MQPLISVAELATARETVTILDVRYKLGGPPGPAEFAAGHVPGAVYVDLDTELAAPPGRGGRHPLPEPAAFTRAMQRLGVSADRPVVVYDDWGARAAGRAWWLLRYFGHPSVRVLDGGWGAWRAAGHPVATGPAAAASLGTFAATPGGMPIVEASGVPAIGVLIDARAPERFRGEVEPVDPVAGHIPGAVNVPTHANLDATGQFRAPAELAAEYARVGAVPGADVAVYCGSGVTAAHDVLALELAGVRAKLYPGSWSSWITDPARPTVRGA
ncbi:MAG TPA: sulfurtransferase [Kofleriaceae bacterium]|jgi:thiosulfate/3-mercaptopyruvate sulfurtransferase|nr:sulfurtransferase [Kofleriaceae bacterium]